MTGHKRNPNGKPAHGYGRPSQPGHWLEVKTIKGHDYLYECWRDEGGTKRSVYQGKAVKHAVRRVKRTKCVPAR